MASGFKNCVFENDVAVVTGAASGIGEACATGLIEAGARVVGVDIDKAGLARLQARLDERSGDRLGDRLGDRFLALELDLREDAAIRASLSTLPPPYAAPTILINSAGICLNQFPAHEMAYEKLAATIDVNVKGLFAVTHVLLAGMVERNRGHVVNIGSTTGTHPAPTANVYGATKSFLKMLSANLRADLVGTRVRVTEIAPGAVMTNIGLARHGGDIEKMRAHYAPWPSLEAGDIAEAVLWSLAQPPGVQVNILEITPLGMAPGPLLRQKTA